MKVIVFIVKIPFYIIKGFLKILKMILKSIFGFLFGWIPDFDERMSGEEFEEYVQAILKHNGYKDVQLTKRSGDYGIDILAKYQGESYAFQCKKYAKPVGVAAIQQAYSGCQYYQCDYAVVVTNSRFTMQAQALAEKNHVDLWDGNDLEKMKRKANRRSLFHHQKQEDIIENQYQSVLEVLLDFGYASIDLLMEQLHYSEEKAKYVLEDLEYHDVIFQADDLGIRDLNFLTVEEAIEILEQDS